MCTRARTRGAMTMKTKYSAVALRVTILLLTITVLAGAAPAMAAVINEASDAPVAAKFTSQLDPKPVEVVKIDKALVIVPATANEMANADTGTESTAPVVRVETDSTETPTELTAASTMAQAPVPQAAPKPTAASGDSVARTGSGTSELAQAKAILARHIAEHPILAGTTVSIGTTPGGYQAVAYYQSGRIVISSSHTASLERILGHEIWHIIDWRDNGQIDWGENVPPN